MTVKNDRASLFPFAPLPSSLRTPEQMEWIHDHFKIDGIERLARADRQYVADHGYYLPDVAALAHAALSALDELRKAIGGAGPLISMNGETRMPSECWRAIETAMLHSGCLAPVVGVVVPEDERV